MKLIKSIISIIYAKINNDNINDNNELMNRIILHLLRNIPIYSFESERR